MEKTYFLNIYTTFPFSGVSSEKLFSGFPACRKVPKNFFRLFLRTGKLQKTFSEFSCRQESFKKLFPAFPADRKAPKNFFLVFLPAGKLQKTFFWFSCRQESFK
ncbi:MAG: hypothetical protein LBQ65_04885 [Tannerellaceae bacterium]|jgi:hypothetical protein|nr:hypothetical protein [Tannerellaceae bacterium]